MSNLHKITFQRILAEDFCNYLNNTHCYSMWISGSVVRWSIRIDHRIIVDWLHIRVTHICFTQGSCLITNSSFDCLTKKDGILRSHSYFCFRSSASFHWQSRFFDVPLIVWLAVTWGRRPLNLSECKRMRTFQSIPNLLYLLVFFFWEHIHWSIIVQ